MVSTLGIRKLRANTVSYLKKKKKKKEHSWETYGAKQYDNPISIPYKSIADRYRPVSYPDGPITARYRFIKNASWESSSSLLP